MNILQFSAGPNGTRNLLLGGGPNLMARSIVTADDVHTNGLYWMRPWDMTLFGAAGAAAMSASGYRYAWLWSSDHQDQYGWKNGGGIHLGWSNDIAIPPRHSVMIIPSSFTIGANSYDQFETPWLVYDPDSEEAPFRLYGHAVNLSASGQDTVLFTSADMLTWTLVGATHDASTNGHAGYQIVYREAADSYWSVGLKGIGDGSMAYWTSADGLTFAVDTAIASLTGDGMFVALNMAAPYFDIGEQRHYIAFRDDGSSGRYPCVVPCSDIYEPPALASSLIDIATAYGNIGNAYPGPKYLQNCDTALEDGIAHVFLKRAFPSDNGLVGGADYEDGGGYDDQICDYYAYVYDEAAARTSAPAGVRASAAGGVVTLQCYDALPQRTYRIYRDTDPGLGTKALVGDISAVQTTDTPGGTGIYYYQMVTLDGASEEGSRIVAPYVSSRSELVNEHVTRALALGATIDTIDLDHLAWAEDVLDELGLRQRLEFWVMPEFGHIKNESNVLSKIFCLGTTLKPRGGDLTFATSSTTYSATAWNSLPGWVGGASAAQGYFGGSRLNNIRRAHKSGGGLTMIGSIQKSNSNAQALFGWGEFGNTCNLAVSSGSPASATLTAFGSTDTHATTLANNSAHIIGGVISPAGNAKVYVEGAPGAGFSGTFTGSGPLKGQIGVGEFDTYFWGTGSGSAKFRPSSGRSFSNSSQFASRHAIFFTTALTDDQMDTLNTRLRAGP
jgi:hypothetical protein